MSDKNPTTVQDELANLNDSNSNNEIVFNPKTGELEVLKPGDVTSPDNTTITDVTTDGFA